MRSRTASFKYVLNNLNYILKSKNRGCVLDIYLARRKKYIHIAFDRPLMFLENTEEILELIIQELRKYGDQSTHKIVFPRLIHSVQ